MAFLFYLFSQFHMQKKPADYVNEPWLATEEPFLQTINRLLYKIILMRLAIILTHLHTHANAHEPFVELNKQIDEEMCRPHSNAPIEF